MSAKDRSIKVARIAIPAYVRRAVAERVAVNPGSSFLSTAMEGFRALGIEVDDEDMPKARGVPTVDLSGMADDAVVGITMQLPHYVRQRLSRYGFQHDLTLKQIVLRGLVETGLAIKDADLAAPDYGRNARRKSDPV